MNQTLETIYGRRTVRSYGPKQIPEEILEELLRAGRYAPSAVGLQGRYFTVVQNKDLMRDIVSATLKDGGKFVPGHVPFYNAPTVIVVSVPREAKYNREDAACSIMNILNAAYSLGLGTCYICSTNPGLNDPDILGRLRLPEHYMPVGCLCVGYPDGEAPEPKERRTGDVSYIR